MRDRSEVVVPGPVKRRNRRVLVLLAAGALALAACGEDDDAGGSAARVSLAVTADEYQFDPDSYTVPSGEDFSVEFMNAGDLEHEWSVIRLGEEIATESDFTEDLVLVEVAPTPAGESATEQFTIDETGSYQVVCLITGHFDAGMEGSLRVE